MENFDTKRLPVKPDDVAPDGSDVRILLQLKRGSMAHFEIAPGAISIAVAHKTIEEIWFSISGRGESFMAGEELFQLNLVYVSLSLLEHTSNSDLLDTNHSPQSELQCRHGPGLMNRMMLRGNGIRL